MRKVREAPHTLGLTTFPHFPHFPQGHEALGLPATYDVYDRGYRLKLGTANRPSLIHQADVAFDRHRGFDQGRPGESPREIPRAFRAP